MESLLVEQSFSPRKQIKNPRRKTPQQFNNPYHLHQNPRFSNNNVSRQSSLSSQNYAPPPQVMMHEFDHMMMLDRGLFLNNHHAPYNHHHGSNSLPPMMSLGQHQQPPLLPFPTVSRPTFRSLPPHQHLRRTTTKIKTPPKKENKKNIINTDINNNNSVKFNSAKLVEKSNESKVTVGPTKDFVGPDPRTLAKDLTRMLLTDLDNGSIFNLAPPPSSLPLPKFYLRRIQQQSLPPMLSCNAEVAEGGDGGGGGATDNLCKLLKLC